MINRRYDLYEWFSMGDGGDDTVIGGSREKPWELFEEAPVSMWDVDFSQVDECRDLLHKRGVADSSWHFDSNPEEIDRCAGHIGVTGTNGCTLELRKTADKREPYKQDEKERIFQSDGPLHHSVPGLGVGLHLAR